MSTIFRTKAVRNTIYIRFAVVILCLTVAVGCQPSSATQLRPTPTPQPPTATITSTATIVLNLSTNTPFPPSISPTKTFASPTITSTSVDVPIVLMGTIIDGTGAEPLNDAVVVIENEYITAVGLHDEIEIPTNARIIEFYDATILPGFINSHVHNAYQLALLKKWAQAGVTTVRDLGAKFPFHIFATRDKNNADPHLATVISAGPLITVPGGYPIAGADFPSLAVTNLEHARREVAQLISDGADVIKIVIESSGGHPTLSLEKATVIVETAHQRDVRVSVHLTSLRDLKVAIDAGIDDVAHIVASERVPADILEQMVINTVYWVPTLEPFGGRDAGNLSAFITLGGHVVLGNDGGMLPGIEIGMPMREIEMMQAAGMSSMEIIVAATSNAAYVCDREETLGTLEVGKQADILVVNGDPLENLQALKNVRLVIHQGEIIRDSAQE